MTPAAAQAPAGPEPAPAKAASSTAKPADREKFRWPLRGPVIAPFKPGENEGIDIKTPVGQAVHAADDGICTYAGEELKTFGKLILIRHANGYVSAYANLSAIGVKEGDRLRRGQVIGESGDSGQVASPRLHFELRKDGKALDPVKSLVPM